MNALANHLPRVRVPWVPIGQWPTPLTPLSLDLEGRLDGRSSEATAESDAPAGSGGRRGERSAAVWIKREGDAHPLYGGNKLRTLEVWFGHVQALGARRIWAIGAYGSNHVIATLLHAARASLEAAAMVFPQPASAWATENAGAIVATGCRLLRLRSVVEVPLAAWRVARRERDAVVMPPGGATTIGTFGALSAAFELADQIAAHLAPPPARIVLAVGSTCTTAGLLAGLALARAVGAWRWPLPIVHGVRVTPWPVTSRLRTADLARRTLARVEQLGGPRVGIGLRELVGRLVIDGRELGRGYGRATPQGEAAIAAFGRAADGPRLDGVYSAKAAAAMIRLHRAGAGPLVFWASKSTATLAPPGPEAIDRAPAALARWLRRHA
ncbi:MAG TPA: pyridoxal-phosphate dependent enzyme [Kofleriaceae bacterium]|nr:pyridoxal-phosphate dependent enzyme [Kofleriaceae bacterium]